MTEDILNNEPEQQEGAKPSAGRVLAEARKRLGLSVDDVAHQLRLSPRQVEALEADDHARLPGKTFLRGFTRNYARLLQLDPEPLLLICQDEQPKDQSIVVPSSRVEFGGKHRLLPFSDRPGRPWQKFAIAIAMAVLFLSWGAYELNQWWQQPSRSAPAKAAGETTMALPLPQPQAETAAQPSGLPAAKQDAEPVPAPLSAPAEAVVAPLPLPAQASAAEPTGEVDGKRILFAFDGDAWVEVKDKSGKIIFSQKNPKGSQQTVRGAPPFFLVVGNAARVRLSYNDKVVDLAPYTKGDVARLTLE